MTRGQRRRRDDGLALRGGAFWDDVEGRYLLDPVAAELARETALTIDLCDDLRAQIRRDGLAVKGSTGQTRVHPAIAQLAATQSVLERLLRRLSSLLEVEDDLDDLVRKLSTPSFYGSAQTMDDGSA